MPIEQDITRLRAETPATANLVHFNNAGASLIPQPVHDAVVGHLELERSIGGYEAAAKAAAKADDFYTAAANLIGADPSEMAFTQNASRAWAMALHALPLKAGDRILCHESEYGANALALLQLCRQRGVIVDLVGSDEKGRIDLAALEQAITPQTRAILLTHAPMYRGAINPAEAVGKIAKAHGLIYILDAAQSLGQLSVNIEQIGCDILCGTGRKFLRGPRGTGLLYVSKRIISTLEPALIDTQSALWNGPENFTYAADSKRFETWERHLAGQIGLASAIDYALELGLESTRSRLTGLIRELRETLQAIKGIRLIDQDNSEPLSAIVTFYSDTQSAEHLVEVLRHQAINLSVVRADQTWNAFRAGMPEKILRVSPHYFNTSDEITTLYRALAEANH